MKRIVKAWAVTVELKGPARHVGHIGIVTPMRHDFRHDVWVSRTEAQKHRDEYQKIGGDAKYRVVPCTITYAAPARSRKGGGGRGG